MSELCFYNGKDPTASATELLLSSGARGTEVLMTFGMRQVVATESVDPLTTLELFLADWTRLIIVRRRLAGPPLLIPVLYGYRYLLKLVQPGVLWRRRHYG